MFPATKPQQCVSAASLTSNVDAEAVNPRFVVQNPDGDHTQKLAITMRDVESIDRAQNQLESTLGFQYFKVNNINFHIKIERDATDDEDNATNVELLNQSHESNASEFYEPKKEINVDVEMEHIFVNRSDEKFTVKEDILDKTDQQQEAVQAKKEKHNATNPEIKNERILENKNNLMEATTSITDISNCPDTVEVAKLIYPGSGNIQTNDAENMSKTFSVPIDTVNSDIKFTHYDAESSELFICDICNKSFEKKTALIRHIKSHLNLHNRAYQRYKTSRKATEHVKTKHTKNKSYSCSYCDYKGCNKSGLSRHINIKHNKNTTYNCAYCSHKAYDKSNLANHINFKHTKSTVFSCPYCSHKAYLKSDLRRHVNIKHTKKIVYSCTYCNYKAYGTSAVYHHVRAAHTKSTVFDCSHCDYKTYNKGHLNNHVNLVHTKNVVFHCSYCDYKSYSKSNLAKHINSRHTKRTVYNCSYCHFKSYDKSSLSGHINNKHTKSTVYNCSYCSHKTYDKRHLKSHVNAVHTKKNVFICSYCEYKSCRKSNLIIHINSKHTKDTVYNCAHCSYKSYNKSNLFKHVKVKHNV